MAANDGMPRDGRYELKYILTESQAQLISAFARSSLRPDAHEGSGQHGYRVFSVYLDDAKLSLYGLVVNGLRNRFKLRVRYYEDGVDRPAFVEIKRKRSVIVHKERAMVGRATAENLLAGRWPRHGEVLAGDGAGMQALHGFCSLRDRLGAWPQALVSYDREAYVDPVERETRLTIDRNLVATPATGHMAAPADLASVGASAKVILELKFTGRFPRWMRNLVGEFELTRCSFSKYVAGIRALGLDHGMA